MSDSLPKRQVSRWLWAPWALATFFIILALSLSACGKKAGHLDAPPDVEEDHFPRIYPDTTTDPKPDPSLSN